MFAAKRASGQGSPESIVTCRGFEDTYKVIGISAPIALNAEQCIQASGVGLSCAPCIISLENQGCKTVDVVTGKSNESPNVTCLLSCVKP